MTKIIYFLLYKNVYLLPVVFHFLVETFLSRVHAIFSIGSRIQLVYKYMLYIFGATKQPRWTPKEFGPCHGQWRYLSLLCAYTVCPRTMGVQNDEMPARGFRGDTRDRDAGTSSRGTSFRRGLSWGFARQFCKINIVGQQPEHGRAQARVLSGLLSRECCHFLHVV